MRILLLSDSDSPHTIRWAKAIHQANFVVSIFSIHTPDLSLYNDIPKISIYSSNLPKKLKFKKESAISKLTYFRSLRLLNQVIKSFKPDVVHSHYISSYGLLGALANFHPLIISVWGADIYNFPNHSIFHWSLIKFSLSKADEILSTSEVMKKETNKYTKKNIVVTPFGIDVNKFYPKKVQNLFNPEDLVIGTVKTLEKKYGIEYLIQAFKIVKEKRNLISLKLLIVGKGGQEKYLKNLVIELNLKDDTIFTGFINHELIQDYHNMLDISVFASIEDSESFGVAVLEASACEKPVVVSNVGGLPEVVDNGKTGFIIKKEDPESIAEALLKLIDNEGLRKMMGKNGRNKVISEYKWEDSVKKMISIYNNCKVK